jgi:hypothetical protein
VARMGRYEGFGGVHGGRERADAVDARLAKREQALRERAAQQREAQRVVCGRALGAMRDRGKSVREIALMAGVAETTARKLIREADAAPDGDGPGSPLPEAHPPPVGGCSAIAKHGVECGAQ